MKLPITNNNLRIRTAHPRWKTGEDGIESGQRIGQTNVKLYLLASSLAIILYSRSFRNVRTYYDFFCKNRALIKKCSLSDLIYFVRPNLKWNGNNADSEDDTMIPRMVFSYCIIGLIHDIINLLSDKLGKENTY